MAHGLKNHHGHNSMLSLLLKKLDKPEFYKRRQGTLQKNKEIQAQTNKGTCMTLTTK